MEPKLSDRIVVLIQGIPRGHVATYGQIAAAAGSPKAARQVVRVLNSSSDTKNLPWHRVVNREGRIVITHEDGRRLQKSMLEAEGIVVDDFKVDLERYRVVFPAKKKTSS